MPSRIDRKDEAVRALGRLGIGLLELIASIREEIVAFDRKRRVVAVLGEVLDESQRPEDLVGRSIREIFGAHAAAVHEAAYARALDGEHLSYEWTRRRGRSPVRLFTTASALRDSSSDIVGVVLVSRSITPVEAADRLLELEQGIQQLTGAIDHYRKTGQSAREFSADSPLSQLSNRERQV